MWPWTGTETFTSPTRSNHRVRKVSPGGTITTHRRAPEAGLGDGGPATKAQLGYPTGVAVDGQGNVYIGDGGPLCVKVSPDGTITTIAGTVICALAYRRRRPGDFGAAPLPLTGVASTGRGTSISPTPTSTAVRNVSASGTITTIAGTGTAGFSGDGGPATSAKLTPRPGWRWTARGTSTSLTATTCVCGR